MEELREQLLFLISTPLYIVIIGVEILLSNYRHRKIYSWKDTAANVYLMLVNTLLELIIRGFYFGLFVYIAQLGFSQFKNAVVYWIMLFLLLDFIYYWLHRFERTR